MGILERAVAAFYRWRFRSSQTGLFVTRKYAEKHPDVTEREKVK